ncbi:MAG: cupin, partial [Chitinophagaceae bacterium]
MQPLQFIFKDDGQIPNNSLPLLIYKGIFLEEKADADAIIAHFKDNGWKNAWKNGVYDYHHYHSITHEVLGIYQGSASLLFGGDHGQEISVSEGDVVIIPAGVGHKRISQSHDFAVVGAYPNGCNYDIMRGDAGERPTADENISKVGLPEKDPVFGKNVGLVTVW